jgi:acetyl-CoA carboxylase carboxyl transferase beta subunit/acetyl-CoA carboxylase carboxyl transferase alpha subunit
MTETAMTGQQSWLICGGCSTMLYRKRFERSARICPECGHHAPLTAAQRLEQLLDPGSVRQLDLSLPDSDPLQFTDSRPYLDRLRDARTETGMSDAVIVARGDIDGSPVVVAAMDFRFLGGSLGANLGEAVTQACEIALHERTPLLLITASGGARMQEGVISLMQMAKTSQAIAQLDEAGVLTISLITDPTYGGVAASFATLTDIIIAEPGARLGFAGPRVIELTIRQSLPVDFQTAEFLLEHGIVDMITPRTEVRSTLARLLSVAGGRPDRIPHPPVTANHDTANHDKVVRDPAQLPERDPWDCVRAARRVDRPTTLDYIAMLVDDFSELHGDRAFADCPALVTGLGRIAGVSIAVIGTQKGHTARELVERNYGMPTPAGYRKSARVMRLAAKLGLPVITLVDTAGAYPGIEAEQHGQSVAIAENIKLMAGLPVPVVSVVTGEGGSGGALALATADVVLMCANAVYSVISAEGCAAILWRDPAAAPKAAAALQLDARSLLASGVVDGVIAEPGNGAETDHLAAANALRNALTSSLAELLPLNQLTLVTARRARFRRFGVDTSAVLDDLIEDHKEDDDLEEEEAA